MNQHAQGFVETAGLVLAIQVADAMAKAAKVQVVMAHKVDGLRVCVICEGDVAACQASVNAGAAIAKGLGGLLGSNVIPRPADGAESLQLHIDEMKQRKAARKAAKEARKLGVAPKTTASPAAKSVKKSGKKPG
ncbi:MAG: BMC domain-containing protein [Deltaproteobacteria bacterium]|jgi:ethanolamine utilization protein EutK|nr:BMC domain-containing protein [Deltaproteobacteria bacterium]